jgi:hypothetical protein
MKIERVPIASLVGDPSNVRRHDQQNLDAIKGSLARFGQQKPIVVGANNVVIAGNGTIAAAMSLGWKEIAIVRSELIGSNATAYAIADNRTAELATWDDDALSQQLAALQIEDEELARATGFDPKELDKLISGDDKYVTVNHPPIYDPNCRKPDLHELFDDSKTRSLISNIDKSTLPEDMKQFLRAASYRHTIIKFDLVADYYANASEEEQKLFEDNFLVIIDYDRAIEEGYVLLNQRIEDLRDEDNDDA